MSTEPPAPAQATTVMSGTAPGGVPPSSLPGILTSLARRPITLRPGLQKDRAIYPWDSLRSTPLRGTPLAIVRELVDACEFEIVLGDDGSWLLDDRH